MTCPRGQEVRSAGSLSTHRWGFQGTPCTGSWSCPPSHSGRPGSAHASPWAAPSAAGPQPSRLTCPAQMPTKNMEDGISSFNPEQCRGILSKGKLPEPQWAPLLPCQASLRAAAWHHGWSAGCLGCWQSPCMTGMSIIQVPSITPELMLMRWLKRGRPPGRPVGPEALHRAPATSVEGQGWGSIGGPASPQQGLCLSESEAAPERIYFVFIFLFSNA